MLSLETLLERMSSGPASIYGLPAPRIAVGEPANLVLLDLAASRVEADEFRSRSANSWLLGERVTGKVRMTVAADGRTTRLRGSCGLPRVRLNDRCARRKAMRR